MLDLHLGDCRDVLPTLPAQSIDMVLCDLPYGSTQNAWDQVIPLDDMWPLVWRVCRGVAAFTAIQPLASLLVASQMIRFRHEWVWHKNKASGHLNAKRGPLRAHETILVFSAAAPPYTPQMTSGHEPGHAALRRKYTPNYGAQRPTEYGGQTTRYPRSVLDFDVVNNDSPDRMHPTQKPEPLMRYFIETYCPPGGTVLDFAMGSGTTGVAALRAGRSFVGIEKDPSYFDAARARTERARPLSIEEMLS